MENEPNITAPQYYAFINGNEELTGHIVNHDETDDFEGYMYCVMFYDADVGKSHFPISIIFKSTHEKTNYEFNDCVSKYLQTNRDILEAMPRNPGAFAIRAGDEKFTNWTEKQMEQSVVDVLLRVKDGASS